LFIENGLENVSLRAIIRKAGQKNESALQYHFSNRDGLILAIQDQRMAQVDARRTTLIDEFMQTNPAPDLRSACSMLVRAPFLLCREDKGFRGYLGVFGQRVIASGQSVTATLAKQDSQSLYKLRGIFRSATSHLDDRLFAMRFENMSSFVLLSMSRRALENGSFSGKRAELFFNNLVDLMAVMLSAPISSNTREFVDQK
jgi:AcrR family transcriptional regulator